MSDRYKIVNVGSHANPPGSMWADYAPPGYRENAPRLATKSFPDGEYEILIVEGVEHRMLAQQLGLPREPMWARSFTDGPLAGRDPKARLEAQDQDGLDAEVIVHPGFPEMLPKDRKIRYGMMYAFNSWLGEFCSHAPDRLIGIGEIPLWDAELAVKEAKRVRELGLRGVMIPPVPGYYGAWSSPADEPYVSPSYEPIWQALEENGLVLVVHADAASATPGLSTYSTPAPGAAGVNMITNKTMPIEAITSLIVGKVFENHPKLKLVCVETGVGWMAHLVSWMDVLQDEQPYAYQRLKKRLSEYFHEHVFGSFLWDTCGIRNMDLIGADNIMWCNDFPHEYGPWPNSARQIDKDLQGVSPEDRRKILAGNAVRVFNLAG
jgi:predicted TIM-barrel fold metal-dependent hydrolase